jgi:hypothetical protein
MTEEVYVEDKKIWMDLFLKAGLPLTSILNVKIQFTNLKL